MNLAGGGKGWREKLSCFLVVFYNLSDGGEFGEMSSGSAVSSEKYQWAFQTTMPSEQLGTWSEAQEREWAGDAEV